MLAEGRIGTAVTKSELEERFLRFLADWGLPRPELNASIAVRGGFVEADCVWRASRLIAELDGRAVHDTAAAFERDRARDRVLNAAGWRVVRIGRPPKATYVTCVTEGFGELPRVHYAHCNHVID